ASRLIVKLPQIVRKIPAELVDPRHNQLPVCPVLQPRILADFLVVLMSCKVHAQDRVIVIRTRKLGRCVGYQHLDELVDVHAAGANHLDAHSFCNITRLYRIFLGHLKDPSKHKASAASSIEQRMRYALTSKERHKSLTGCERADYRPRTAIPTYARVSPIMNTTVTQETKFTQREFTQLPIRSRLLISRIMKMRTSGSSTPLSTWDSRIMRTRGKCGIRIEPAPATMSDV